MTVRPDEERPPAPGELALVQDFMNASDVDPAPSELAVAAAIRRAREEGEPQATLAAQYGVSRQLVSAIVRGKRLVEGEHPGHDALSYGSPRTARAWLHARGFISPTDPVGEPVVHELRELRGVLLAMGLANNGQPLPAGCEERFTALAHQHPVVVELRAGGAILVPAGRGVEAFIAHIIATVYDAIRSGTWPRLKVCPADRCHTAFYDTSKNRTATWCSMSICGNRTKVRNYQRRRKTTPV